MEKKNKIRIASGLALLALFFVTIIATASCFVEKGSGNVIKEERSVANFKAVSVSSAIDVILTKGNEQSVIVEADDNIIKHILTEVSTEGVLRIKMDKGLKINNPTKLIVYVTFVNLNELVSSGASSIKCADAISAESFRIESSGASDIDCHVSCNKMEIELSGASEIKLKGQSKEAKIEVSGASDLTAGDFVIDNATMEVSGASNAKVNAAVKIKAEVSGASDLNYTGAANAEIETSGASEAHKF